MPTCPSCTSIILAADPANTFCTSIFTVTVDCASNPFLQARSRVEYSSDNGVLAVEAAAIFIVVPMEHFINHASEEFKGVLKDRRDLSIDTEFEINP